MVQCRFVRLFKTDLRTRLFRIGILCFLGLIGAATPTKVFGQWTQVWADDFNEPANTAPDPSKWTYDLGNNFGNGELDIATDNRANSYQDGKGNLVIALLCDPASGPCGSNAARYTSAHLKTAGLYAAGPYGKMEARIKLPYGNGIGAAFWSLGNDYVTGTPWPQSGEIDIMEHIGREPSKNFGTIHGPGYADYGIGTPYTLPNGGLFQNDYHTFGLIWSPFRVQWYVDDTLYGDLRNTNLSFGSLWEFNDPIYLIVSAGVGGGFAGNPDSSTVFPQYMYVDYVHVFQWTGGPPSAPSNLSATDLSATSTQLNWSASSDSDVTYNIYGSTDSNFKLNENTSLIASDVTGSSYKHSGLLPGTTHYYKVLASGPGGESAPTGVASATTAATGAGPDGNPISINDGGYAVGAFSKDVYWAGGNASSGQATISASSVAHPAPPQVYTSGRWGSSTYVIPDLSPNAPYTVRLHFAEITFSAAGQRVFNVFLNGMLVLNNFDIFAAAGGKNIPVEKDFDVTSDKSGDITLQFATGTADQPIIDGIEVTPGGTGGTVSGGNANSFAVNCGGSSPAGAFVADTGGTGGSTTTVKDAIDTSGVSNAAPAAVYESYRVGSFTYVIPNLRASTPYLVRLHFAETYWTAPGARLENVSVNGKQVLTNFDVFAAAGGKDKAVVEQFTILAPQNGVIQVAVNTVKDNAILSGIEVIAAPGATVPPSPATNLVAFAADANQVKLSWSSNGDAGVNYNVYRSNNSSFLPSAESLLAGNVTGAIYTDHSVVGTTTYYYIVNAVNAAGTSLPASTATITTPFLNAGPNGLNSSAGSGQEGGFLADLNYSGGGTGGCTRKVDPAEICGLELQ